MALDLATAARSIIRTMTYSILREVPSVETYRALRRGSGLSEKTTEAAERGLPRSLFGVQVLLDATPIGMGRVVGDGGCFFQIVDIAVLKEHQGRGVGKTIMREIVDYIEVHVPESGYVSLIADGEAHELYAQFGFVPTAPASVGMVFKPQRV
jgi:GNAT superfamily N-acetyltransferase